MSETHPSENNQAVDNSFAEINWMSLWQTSGNNWSWMLEKECLPTVSRTANRTVFKFSRKLIVVELFGSFLLLALAIALPSFPTPQSLKAIDAYRINMSAIHRYHQIE